MVQPSSGTNPEGPGRRTNGWRAQHALGAGLLCLGFFAIAGIFFLFSAMWGRWNPIFGGSLAPAGPLNYLGMLATLPIAALGAAMPARALGASWRRALVGASTITLAFSWVLFVSGLNTPALLTAVFAPIATIIVGCWRNSLSDPGTTVVFASSATLLIAAYLAHEPGKVAAFALTLPAWVILPVVAGLYLPQERVR